MSPQPSPPRGVLFKWAEVLPLTEKTPLLSLGEGDTPLVRSAFLESECGLDELWFKLESCNPTGSFKDRGMVVATAKAVEDGATAIMCASTGNTSASAAAYAARSGLEAIILVPKGNIAMGKMAQAVAFGARIVELNGNFGRRADRSSGDHGEVPNRTGELGQSVPHRRAENRGVRNLRILGRSSRHSRDTRWQRGEHYRLLEGLLRVR